MYLQAIDLSLAMCVEEGFFGKKTSPVIFLYTTARKTIVVLLVNVTSHTREEITWSAIIMIVILIYHHLAKMVDSGEICKLK